MERNTGEKNPDLLKADGEAACSDITLRDLFAAFCAGGMMAKFGDNCGMERSNAAAAYAFADALLEQRKQREGARNMIGVIRVQDSPPASSAAPDPLSGANSA